MLIMNHKKRTVTCDSCSLILLTKANIIGHVVEKNEIIIPEIVYVESIERGKIKGSEDAYLLEKLKDEGRIRVDEPGKKSREKIDELFSLRGGERDVVALGNERKIIAISDDKKAMNACKVLGIEKTTALGILDALHEKKRITKKEALDSLEKLERHGWYKKELIGHVKRSIEER